MPNFIDPEETERNILHALVKFSNAYILEVGCGDGRLSRHYVEAATRVVGVDSDWDELRLAWDEYLEGQQHKVTLSQARAEQLPYANNSFDVVVMGWSL